MDSEKMTQAKQRMEKTHRAWELAVEEWQKCRLTGNHKLINSAYEVVRMKSFEHQRAQVAMNNLRVTEYHESRKQY